MNAISKRFRHLLFVAYATAAFLSSTTPVHADDTDIYVNNTPAPPSVPMVMFSLDYRPNLGSTVCSNISSGCAAAEYFRKFPETAAWMDKIVPAGGTFEYFDMLRLALHVVLSDITGVKVGLMMNHDNANNCVGPDHGKKCSNGGYVVRGFNQLVDGDTNGAFAAFTETLFALELPQGNISHSYQGKELYFEFFRYLTGQGVYNAHNGWTDYGTNSNENVDATPAISWDPAIEHPSTKSYISPLVGTDSCASIFAINFYGGQVNQEDDSDTAIAAARSSGGLGVAMDDFLDIVAYMHDADLADDTYGAVPKIAGNQNVTSYFITAKPTRNEHELAEKGGTNKALVLTDDPQALVDTLTGIFKEILSVSTTFVAASVPVNVFNRSESLDNVFIALFQAENEPFWNGNLKKLKLKVVTSEVDQSTLVELQDVYGSSAIAIDGRIKHDALTYWTNGEKLPAATPDTEEVEGRDGRVVNRGAAGQMIPGFIDSNVGLANDIAGGEPAAAGPRKVLYDNGVGNPLIALNADTDTAELLKDEFGTDAAGALDAITWLRGIDPELDTTRAWLMGDPLHSRPLPINYGLRDGHSDETNPLIYIAMASNDGYMHFIRNTNGDGGELGKEVWAFVPTDIMGTIPALVKNAPMENPKHPYTVDGAPAVYLEDANGDGSITGDEEAYLYFGLRRGGKVYYALDISDPNAPELAWKIDATGDFAGLGQTWSRPQVGMVDYDADGTPDPVVIFGGGYDTDKDAYGLQGTDDNEGNAIYVVEAKTGKLIYKAVHDKMVDSIPSDVTAVDTNGDLLVDRIVVGDTGGNVWRVDTYGVLANWQTTLLASLGRHAATGTENDRRFFHRPDFVQAQAYVNVEETVDGVTTVRQELQKFDAVLVGSGNRANPLDRSYATKPDNWLYMIRDDRLKPAKASPSPAYVVDDLTVTHDTLGDITNPSTGSPTSHGWKLLLDAGDAEKSLSSPLTLSNTVFFTTYLPTGTYADEIDPTEETTCGPSEGSGLLYAVDLATGKPKLNYNSTDDDSGENTSAEDRYKELDSGGIPADVVGINLDGQAYVLPPDLTPEKVNAATRWRTFWYEVEDSDL